MSEVLHLLRIGVLFHDAEACKAAGNKFFKAKDYDRAIKEYTKGMRPPTHIIWILF